MASIGFWSSIVFYNAYLPEVAYPEDQDRVSAKGFILGYMGSIILLVINLGMILNPGHARYYIWSRLTDIICNGRFMVAWVLLRSLLEDYQIMYFKKKPEKRLYMEGL